MIAELERALADDAPLLQARAHLSLGSIAAARDAYRRAGAAAELQLLDTLVAQWFDHPRRLAFLFPMRNSMNFP